MRARTLAATGLACLLGACTDSADPMSVISPSTDEASVMLSADEAKVTLARGKHRGYLAAYPPTAALTIGDTLRIRTSAKAFNGIKVTPKLTGFASEDTSVATADKSGLVTAQAAGQVRIRVWAEGPTVKYAPVFVRLTVVAGDVSQKAPAISAEPPSAPIPVGQPAPTRPAVSEPPRKPVPAPTPAPSPAPAPAPPAPAAPAHAPLAPAAPAPAPAAPAPAPPAPAAPAPAPAPPKVPTPAPSPAPAPAAPAPSPAPPGSGFGNEPAGFRPIIDRHFSTSHQAYGYGSLPKYATGMNASLAEGFENIEGKYPNFSVVPDPTAVDGMVGQMKYPKGMPAGVGPATARLTLPPGIREAYFSFWVKLSPNWFGNDAAVNKQFFIGLNGGNNQLVLDAHGYGSQKLIVKPVTQGLADARDGGKAWPYQNPTEIIRGVWQRWELLVRVSSAPNVADGQVRFWQDGKLTAAWDNVNTTRHNSPGSTPSVHMLNWNPTYGGGGTAVPADQYQWVDRIYISGR